MKAKRVTIALTSLIQCKNDSAAHTAVHFCQSEHPTEKTECRSLWWSELSTCLVFQIKFYMVFIVIIITKRDRKTHLC